MGGSGVQRSAKFVKFLRDFDFEPVVLTKKRDSGSDDSLMQDIPDGIEIIEVPGIDFDSKTGVLSLPYKVLARKILIPDSEILWAKKAFKYALERISKADISIVYTTSFPYSDHMLGLRIKERFPDMPWVADFRDEWTKNPYILDMNLSKSRMRKEEAMEMSVLDSVDGLITNTDRMLEGFLELKPELKSRSYVIPNGFDDADFNSATGSPAKDVFKLTYAGSMYGRRKPDLVLQAISELVLEGSIDRKKISVEFIGNMKRNVVAEKIYKYDLSDVVSLHSYMKHRELLEKLSKSACLLLLIGQGVGAENFSSGKIFEYIKLGRKILAVVPVNGEAAKIVRETNSGIIADCSDLDGIKSAVLKLYKEFFSGDVYPSHLLSEVEKYHRRVQTETLSEVFDATIALYS